ncbi:OmpA family protein [Magnetovibrio blakemorei]|nr:OmpA family protein [Magnetovibrio blakemorei]
MSIPRRILVLSATFWLSACITSETPKPLAQTSPEYSTAFHEAIEDAEKRLRDKPNDREARLNLARTLRWAGRIEDAAQVLDTPPTAFANDTKFWAERGKLSLLQGNSLQGLAQLERATQGTTGDWRLYSAIGIANDTMNRYGDAEIAYRKALELCPNDAGILNNLGVSQGLSGRLDQAVLTLKDALHFGQHTDLINRNLRLFTRARDLCATCSTDYLKQGDSLILAAGLTATDQQGSCTSGPQTPQIPPSAMVETLAAITPDAPPPSVNIKVYFEFDSATLKPETMDTLNTLGEALTYGELNNYRFQIAGHTDAVGLDDYNLKLSSQRAQAVSNYLVTTFAIDPARLEAVGFGESQLLDWDHPDGEVNRRVQVTRLDHL